MNKPKALNGYKYPSAKEEMPLGPGSYAGVLIDVNSGWRTFRPAIDLDMCKKCLICWLLCPDGAIDKSGDRLEIDYDYCKGCGICAYECPVKAITMVKEGERQ